MNRTKITVALALSGTMALAACDPTYQGQPGPNNNQNAKTGAAIGGVLGAAVGLNSKEDRLLKGAVGAGIGAAIGGAIGNNLDRQAEALRGSINNDQVRIVNTGRELIVTMPQDILFDVDSTYVRDGLRSDLRALARNLQDYPDSTVAIIGHTDNTGTAAYNQDLSTRRARAVSSILVDSGVRSSRIRAIGRGEEEPIASNLNASGRAQNRRVEIIIRPNT